MAPKQSDETPSQREDVVRHKIPQNPLPRDLQNIVDRESDFLDSFYEGQAPDSRTTGYRYAAYASRARTILLSAHRYIAYTSDIGESFRPIAHPWLVRGAYGISWAYLLGDVSNEGYKAYCRNQRLLHPCPTLVKQATSPTMSATAQAEASSPKAVNVPAIEDHKAVMAKRAVFQVAASMALPAFTIHSVVRYSGRGMKNVKSIRLRTWGPIGLGLAVVPALPYLFDHPVETATEWLFYSAFRAIGGEKAVGERKPEKDSKDLLESSARTKKEL